VARFRVGQAVQNADPAGGVFSGSNLNTNSSNLAYQSYIEHKDNEVFVAMQTLKKDLDNQKSLLQNRQSQVTKVRDDLAAAKAQLDSQKSAKVQLLRATQNDEARYQRMLIAARREAEQITAAYNNKGGSRYVRRGEAIGTEGCTGYCYGTHLHFGLYNQPFNYNHSQNPCAVLSCDGQGDVGYIRSGRYQVPITWPGTTYSDVSQWWGMTWFARSPYNGYGGGPHTGIDMYTYQGDVVRAAEEGQAYFSRGGQAAGNGVFIYHPDGHVTLYWHLN
jgi:hypothetical protein